MEYTRANVSTQDRLASTVDSIIELNDDERQHAQEDRLHMALIRAYCPKWVVVEVERLSDADFCRWHG